MARKRKKRRKSKAKVQFLGHEIFLTFIGALIISLGAMLASTGLQPALLTWILSTLIIWLGLLIFMYPVIKKIETLM